MPNRVTLRTLRRVHCVLKTSFLAYLGHAKPYAGPDRDASVALLDELVAQQRKLARSVADRVRELEGEVDRCDFSAAFTSAHDVSIDYALRRAADLQGKDLAKLEALRDEQADPKTDALLESVIDSGGAIRDRLEAAVDAAPSSVAT